MTRQVVSGGTVGPLKTPKSERVIELDAAVFEALREWHAAQTPPSDWVFTGTRGGLMNPTNLTRLCVEVGFNPHLARHYGATKKLKEHPEQVYEISRFLGHADISTTVNVYVHDDRTARLPGSVLRRLSKTVDRAEDRATGKVPAKRG